MMPLMAFIALTIIFAVLMSAGNNFQDQFDLIENEQVLALEHSHLMEKLAIKIRQSLADAATVGDFDRVLEADSLAVLFRQSLDTYSLIPSIDQDESESIAALFSTYYTNARKTSLQMLEQELDESVIAAAVQMNQDFAALQTRLDSATDGRQLGIATAFDSARVNIERSGKGISATILILFLVLLFVSIGAIVSVLRPMRRLMTATEAIAQGDMEAEIDYTCRDEMGRLADSFRRMQKSLIAEFERREKMEMAVRDSEKQYRLLANNMSDIIWTLDVDNNVTYFSPSVKRHLGYTPEEALGMEMEKLFVVDEYDATCTEVEALFKSDNPKHESVVFDAQMRRKDGTPVWMEISINLLIDENEEIVGLSASSRDITDRKLAQEALHKSEERLRSIFINATIGIFRTSPQGSVIDANPAAAQIFGYQDTEDAIKQIEDIATQLYADPEDRKWMIEALQLNGEVNAEIMFKRKGKGDEIFPAQLNTWTIKNEDGTINCIEGMIEDITDRQLMQEAVRSSEERLLYAFDAANDGMFDYNIKEDHLYLSPRYISMLGYETHELNADFKSVHKLMHPDDKRKGTSAFKEHLRTGKAYDLELRFRHKDGHYIWIQTRAKIVEWDEEGKPMRFVGTNVDISARKEAEEKLRKAQQELLDTAHNAGMAEIATSVLHNVGNALNGALTSTTVMDKTLKSSRITHLKRLAELVKEHEKDFISFVSNTEQGRKLPQFFNQMNEVLAAEKEKLKEEVSNLTKSHEHIRQIIALQQQYAGMPGYRESVYAKELVQDAVQLFGTSFARHHIKFSIKQSRKLSRIKVEKHKVLQILINLLKNARDAVRDTDREQREITVFIDQNDKKDLIIKVTDNGMGIDEEHLKKVFVYGFTTKRDGHGYGLHGCANSAREMGGSLTASSKGVNQGATFTLNLPLKKTEEDRVRTADVD